VTATPTSDATTRQGLQRQRQTATPTTVASGSTLDPELDAAAHDEPTSVLLSRVAEAVYWTGRYLERVETTARIVKVQTELYLDLPLSEGVGWSPLLAITGTEATFEALYAGNAEEDVVNFLAADPRNPSSIISSLARARQNMRTTRPVFPRELWEDLNNLYLITEDLCEEAVPRRTRLQWLDNLLGGCQRLSGMMTGTMSHDDAYSFLRIGRHIERADMTSRVLDVHAGTLTAITDQPRPYADVAWMSVLKSLSAYQMYRRKVQASVMGPDVLRFLLLDQQFPRSVEHCLIEISRCLLELPRYDKTMAACAEAEIIVANARVGTLAREGLHDYVDALQLSLGNLHGTLADTYFRNHESAR